MPVFQWGWLISTAKLPGGSHIICTIPAPWPKTKTLVHEKKKKNIVIVIIIIIIEIYEWTYEYKKKQQIPPSMPRRKAEQIDLNHRRKQRNLYVQTNS
jgi:hypothetical protein